LKILILHSELGVLRGGGENYTRNLFSEFLKRGHQVSAAFISGPDGKYALPIPAGIEPIPIPGRWSRKFGQVTLSKIGEYLSGNNWVKTYWDRGQESLCWRTVRWHACRFQRRIERDLAKRWQEFDAVYVHGDPSLASTVASFRPTVLFLPGPVGAQYAPALRMVHVVCAHGDALVRTRELVGDMAIELSIGVDSQVFSPGVISVRAGLGWTTQHRVLGYVGRLAYVKGVDLLATAFRDLSRTVPDVRLLIVGSGEEEGKIRSILAKELAQGLVYFESNVSHQRLAEWYRAMDLFVLPSRYENYANVILEALACGVPFLASDVGGNSMLGETGAGWLFEAGSVSSLSESLSNILQTPSEMMARGAIGCDFVHEHHSWAASAAQLECIIESLFRGE